MKNAQQIHIHQKVRIVSLSMTGISRRHLLEMGLIPGTCFYVKRRGLLKDPLIIHVRGYDLTIRKSEAERIIVEDIL